jgi:O-antigen ligase
VLATLGNIQVVETSYLALKRANWALGVANPILGVGPGNSNVYLSHMKAAGIYPPGLPNYDPHSTWVGAFSETGLVGLITLTGMVGFWVLVVWKRRLLSSGDAVLRSTAVYLLILLIESVLVDAMNFRQLWLAVALVQGTDMKRNESATFADGVRARVA